MSRVVAHGRTRAHHSITLALTIAGATSGMVSCGPSALPRPSYVQVKADDYVPVPFMPRPPPVEIVPAKPKTAASGVVWADGGWQWSGERFRWDPGAWVAPAPGAKRARWVVVRRVIDGQLFFAPSTWRDSNGQMIDPPTPLARASTRAGGGGGGNGGLDD